VSGRPSLDRQIAGMHAEIKVRRDELRRSKARESEVAYTVETLEAVVATLRWLKAHEPLIRQRLFNGDLPPEGGCW
jgi:hypothetical protein